MRKFVAALALGLALGNAGAAEMSEEQKTFYALGQVLARNVTVFNMSKAELDAVQKGFRDGVLGSKAAVDMNVYGPKIQPLAEARQTAEAEKSAASAIDCVLSNRLSDSYSSSPVNSDSLATIRL